MSNTLTEVRDTLNTLEDTIQQKHNELCDTLDEDLNELDEYRKIFDDTYEARDCKDYFDDVINIFASVSEAEEAEEFYQAAAVAGMDDVYDASKAYEFYQSALNACLEDEDLEEIAEELSKYRDLGDLGPLQDLEAEVFNLKVKIEALEAQRVRALAELGGKSITQAEAEQRFYVDEAYDKGLTDGILAIKELKLEQVDFDLTEEDK